MKKLITIISICAVSIITKGQSVSYKIEENNPDKKNLSIHLNPFNVQGYSADITIGYNLQAKWLASKLFQIEADYRKAYLDINADGVFSPPDLKKSSQMEVGGAFNLVNKLGSASHKIVLRSHSDGRYRYTSFIHVNGDARKIFALRGGFVSFYSNYKIDNDISRKFEEGDIKGKLADGNIRYLRDTINFETINYTARSAGFYAGIDFKSIRHMIIYADDYGRRSNKAENNFYADIIFTPLVKYELKPNDKQSGYNNVDINISDNKRKMLGWRFGWHYTFKQSVGFNAKMEVGQQPGVPKESFFLTCGFGMTIGLKTKLINL